MWKWKNYKRAVSMDVHQSNGYMENRKNTINAGNFYCLGELFFLIGFAVHFA